MKTFFKFSSLFIKLYIISLMVLGVLGTLFASEINKTFFGDKAIEGYDVVSYFTGPKPVEGKKEFTYHYKEANWLFSSEKNMELFKANPEKYEPQYGGYCAWGVATKSKKYGIEVDQWTIVDGKLYLNYSESVRKDWKKDIPKYIAQGDDIWPSIKND